MARRRLATVSVVVALVGCLAVVRAQTQGAAGSQDVLPALLSEVRGLRVAMEQMATAGARVQLVLGRLQLQEQRLNNVIKRLDETRTRLAETQRGLTEAQEQLTGVEAGGKEGMLAFAQGMNAPPELMAQAREAMQKQFKQQVTHMNAEVQRLTLEEATLATDVSTEQARWMEFNQKLEELERGLARK
jgi:hypothetical protein